MDDFTTIPKLLDDLRSIQISKLTFVGGYALWAWDILITLDSEIKYIWSANWSLGKVLYIYLRYVYFVVSGIVTISNIFNGWSQKFCEVTFELEAYTAEISMIVVQIVLTMRTYALYGRNKIVLGFLIVLNLVTNGAWTGFNLYYTPRMKTQTNPYPEVIPGCYRHCTDCYTWFHIFWIPQTAFDLILTIMTVYKAVSHVRKRKIHTKVLAVLHRDGLLYFATIFSCLITHLVLWNTVTVSKMEVFSAYFRGLTSIMSCRMMLNVRGVFTKDDRLDVSRSGQPLTHGSSIPLGTICYVTTDVTTQIDPPASPATSKRWHDLRRDEESGDIRRNTDDSDIRHTLSFHSDFT